MKNKKLLLRISFALILGLFVQNLFGQGVPIKRGLFGQNAWVIAPPTFTTIAPYLPQVKESRPTVCRIGGIDPNFRPMYTWNANTFAVNSSTDIKPLTDLIDTLRGSGMEPIVQVGYNPVCTNPTVSAFANVSRANQALIAKNVVAALKSHYGVNSPKLYIIANEPNLKIGDCNYADSLKGYGYQTIQTTPTPINHADTIAAYIKDFAINMRTADSTITLIGPEITSYGNDSNYVVNRMMQQIIRNQTTPPIMGKMTGFNRYYLDIISYHDYLSSANSHTSVIAAPTKTNDGFRTKLNSSGLPIKEGLIDMLLNNGSGRNINNTKLACTELNIDLRNFLSESGATNYNNRINGFDNRSFIGGQWLADVYSQAMDLHAINGLGQKESYMEFMNPWSIREGDCLDGLGFMSACSSHNARERPMYWHYHLLTRHMVGRFYMGTTNNPKVKAFASAATPYGFKVMVLNQDTVNDYHFQINTMGNTNTVNISQYPLLMNFDFTSDPTVNTGTNTTFLSVNGSTPNPIYRASTVVLFFDCYGNPLTRIDYTKEDAKEPNPQPPGITQIGNNVVDPSWIACGLPFGIGGTISANTAFSNTTVPVSSNVYLAPGVSLTFDNCLVVMTEGTKIYGTRANSVTLNKSMMVGCNGLKFEGIELSDPTGSSGSLSIDSSIVVNGDRPVYTDRIQSINITNSFFVNGVTGINLNRSPQGFKVENTLVGNFTTGLRTTGTLPDYNTTVVGNFFLEADTAISYNNEELNQNRTECNRIEFYQIGLSSTNVVISNFGSPATGAGNRFTKMNTIDQYNFLHHTGNSPTYYYDPSNTTLFPSYVMNINMSSAAADARCSAVMSETCTLWTDDVSVKEWATGIMNQLQVYPNPSTGAFSLEFPYATGKYTMSVYDVMGRIVLTQEVNFDNEKAISFEIKERGMYIVSLQNGTKRTTQKVVVE